MGVLCIRATMLHFFEPLVFADSCNNDTSWALSQYRLKRLLAPSRVCVCVCVCVCLSVRTEQLSSHLKNIHEI